MFLLTRLNNNKGRIAIRHGHHYLRTALSSTGLVGLVGIAAIVLARELLRARSANPPPRAKPHHILLEQALAAGILLGLPAFARHENNPQLTALQSAQGVMNWASAWESGPSKFIDRNLEGIKDPKGGWDITKACNVSQSLPGNQSGNINAPTANTKPILNEFACGATMVVQAGAAAFGKLDSKLYYTGVAIGQIVRSPVAGGQYAQAAAIEYDDRDSWGVPFIRGALPPALKAFASHNPQLAPSS